MRQYLLDSAPLAAYLNGRQVAVDLISPWIARRHAQLRRLLCEVYPYFLTYAIMDRYANIRRQLRPPHGPGLIGDIDTLIAATALERDLTVVTTDSDFERVPQLKVMLITLRA